MGALRTSQKTGVPLIMLDVSVSSGWRLHSWDAFTIPRPFSRCSLTFSNPITTDPHLIPAELDVLRERLEDEMNETVRHEPDE